jgi:hypothetical protein
MSMDATFSKLLKVPFNKIRKEGFVANLPGVSNRRKNVGRKKLFSHLNTVHISETSGVSSHAPHVWLLRYGGNKSLKICSNR